MRRLLPQTLLLRTFLLISLLIFVTVATWLSLFSLATREPRAQQLGQLAVSLVHFTRAALLAAHPGRRIYLLRDLAASENVHIYPAEPSDIPIALPDKPFFLLMQDYVRKQLGLSTRFAQSVNGLPGIWVSFYIEGAEEDEYWLVLPAAHAETTYPWHWLGWGLASLALVLLVTWFIVSRVTRPLRMLSQAARQVGQGQHPEVLAQTGATELRQLAEAFNRMSIDLKRSDAERAEILAGISHDLRTPLARLRLEAEMSVNDTDSRDAIVADIEQMDTILGEFLEFARNDAGEQRVPVDLPAFLTQIVDSPAHSQQGISCSFAIMPPLLAYPGKLRRAIDNLLDNARKYGAEPINLTCSREGNMVLIDIMDRGPGIPAAETERLKRPFTRLNTARSDASGTGLGLAIVERTAQLHGGHLELLPREGGGLIARLRFPLNSLKPIV